MGESPIKQHIFKQDSKTGWRAIALIVFAIVLMIADQQSYYFHQGREKAAVIVTPIEYVVNLPLNLVEDLVTDLETQHSLIKQDAKLKSEILLLQAQLQKSLAIESENKQLKQLLQSSSRAGGQVLQAEILAVSPNPYLHQIIINKGSQQGVYQGQPVLDAYGIMGQVIQVGLLTSRVLLITDDESAIPVQDSRSGVRAIAMGDSHLGLLKLANVTQTTNVKPGDLLIASGLGQRYPYGYPVGTITSIKQIPGAHFLQILIKPTAHLNRSRLVLLVWPEQVHIDKAVAKGLKNADKKLRKQQQGISS